MSTSTKPTVVPVQAASPPIPCLREKPSGFTHEDLRILTRSSNTSLLSIPSYLPFLKGS